MIDPPRSGSGGSRGASCARATFRRADLEGADLSGANLSGADLSGGAATFDYAQGDVAAGGVRLPPADVHFVRTAIEKTQAYAPPDRSIFVVPYQPMMYVLADRRNPTRSRKDGSSRT